MLSYRHGFHAGNHADVLKHVVFVQLLDALMKKNKGLWVIDTHAGAGVYSLEQGFARQNAEFETGIARLWAKSDLPGALSDYVAQVRIVNPDGKLRVYPGSPKIALQMLRDQDRLRLFERHTNESKILKECMQGADRRVSVVAGDGFAGLKAVLPPPSRRALVLIDPSYEDKAEYHAVLEALRDALQRFATGTYTVWYPKVQRRESDNLPGQLRRLAAGDWLDVSLDVTAPAADGFGLHGSGLFVFNPPWKLETRLREAMPVLVQLLGQDAHAAYDLHFRQS
ncbi:MAG: 23S rRNA (adenine(2030)-N(6))-methyltransferase RlmJ [Betaproteobacteria bacterium]